MRNTERISLVALLLLSIAGAGIADSVAPKADTPSQATTPVAEVSAPVAPVLTMNGVGVPVKVVDGQSYVLVADAARVLDLVMVVAPSGSIELKSRVVESEQMKLAKEVMRSLEDTWVVLQAAQVDKGDKRITDMLVLTSHYLNTYGIVSPFGKAVCDASYDEQAMTREWGLCSIGSSPRFGKIVAAIVAAKAALKAGL